MPHSHLANTYDFVRPLAQTDATLAVYQHIPSRDLVVIKSFPTGATNVDEVDPRELGYKELTINRALQQHPHENVVQLRDYFIENGQLHLVTDYCAGGDLLSSLLSTSTQWTEGHVVSLFRQIAKGLAHVHRHDIAHLDVSLENVLLDGVSGVRLCDFGLGLLSTPTKFGGVGKLYYMAPEMFMRRAYNAQAADRWALGVVLFMLLTGRPLFEEATLRDQNYKIFFEAQAASPETGVSALIARVGLHLSPAALDLITKLLNPSPMRRLSLDEVLAHKFLHPTPPVLKNLRKRSASQPVLMSVHALKPMLSMRYLSTLATAS
ncbi:serine/threonine protein kinase [Saprolegnia parasitica CBS 223.65]|uniref:Serine/threonine protein kinase n=1 Tax=Saprolegnia parasitica (strain CBS 223.65) TaxID=695850 RepID=A0A067CGF5_SAPPC|nr:serine/threonine protein kinase [Saprolegnia parasitica CBS 223.65]KDO29834.1 serine/threonine protein kinase [Saprolegnia parasitica CBS 223.65]|eukprot:XP_012199569.1 serine/threonine protein kinase [Saprolegnia parasitica CBS 223.65]